MTKQVDYVFFTVIAPVSFTYGGKSYTLRAGDILKERKDKADKMMEGLPFEVKNNLRRSGTVSKQPEEPEEPEESKPEETPEDLTPLEEPPSLEESIEVEEDPPEEETPSENSEPFRKLEGMDKDTHWATVKKFVQDLIDSPDPHTDVLEATKVKFSHYSSITDLIEDNV